MNSLGSPQLTHQVLTIFLLLGLFFTNTSKAKTTESSIYFCKDKGVIISVNNLNKTSNCVERKILTKSPALKASNLNRTEDPLPHRSISSTTIPNDLQLRRDVTRSNILKLELSQAYKTLKLLQDEYQNGSPERLGGEKNHQKYLHRTEGLKLKITEAQSNIKALQRELEREV